MVRRHAQASHGFTTRLSEFLNSMSRGPAFGCRLSSFDMPWSAALIADERGQAEASRQFAAVAQQAAAADHSGFKYHPNLGLAGPIDSALAQRLADIKAPVRASQSSEIEFRSPQDVIHSRRGRAGEGRYGNVESLN